MDAHVQRDGGCAMGCVGNLIEPDQRDDGHHRGDSGLQ